MAKWVAAKDHSPKIICVIGRNLRLKISVTAAPIKPSAGIFRRLRTAAR
jgi:hypothetical protein